MNDTAAEHIDNLFARNERVVCHFSSQYGRMALVMVGAMVVGSIATVFHGVVPPHRPYLCRLPVPAQTHCQQGDYLGHFQLGSTVILLSEMAMPAFALAAGDRVQIGQSIVA